MYNDILSFLYQMNSHDLDHIFLRPASLMDSRNVSLFCKKKKSPYLLDKISKTYFKYSALGA